jgi:hypothetical protein
VIDLYILFEDDFGTLMTGKLANKYGPIAPSIAGYPENRRIPGVFFTSRRNHRRQVAYAHQAPPLPLPPLPLPPLSGPATANLVISCLNATTSKSKSLSTPTVMPAIWK